MANFEDDLDDGLNDDLDFDLDPFAEPPPAKNKREAVTRSLTKGAAGFKEGMTSFDMDAITDMAKNAIPSKLSKEVSIVSDIGGSYKRELQESGKTLRKEGKRLLSTIDRYLPKDGKASGLLNSLKNKMGDDGPSGPSKEELQNQRTLEAITNALGANQTRDEYKDMLNQSLQHKKDTSLLNLTAQIANNSEHDLYFKKDVANAYYRKSLELKYQHVYIAKEQLEVSKAIGDTVKNQLESIVVNTSLPDIIKARSTEALKTLARDKAFTKTLDGMFGNKSWITNLKEKGVNKIKTSTTSILEGMTTANDMSDSSQDMKEMAAMAGGTETLAGGQLGEYLRNKLIRTTSDKLAKGDSANKNINEIREMFLDPSEYLKDKSEKSGGKTSKIYSMLSNLTRNSSQETAVASFSKDMDEAAMFDNRAHVSLTQVIPGLLSKILSSTEGIRTGTKQDEISYNYESRQFLDSKGQAKAIKNTIATNLSRSGASESINSAVKLFVEQSKGKFSTDEIKTLNKIFTMYVVSGKTTVPKFLIKDGIFETLPKELKDKATKAMESFLTKGDPDVLFKRMSLMNEFLTSARHRMPDSSALIKSMVDSGNIGALEKTGIASFDKDTGLVKENRDGYKKAVSDVINKSNKGNFKDLYKVDQDDGDPLLDKDTVDATVKAKAEAAKKLRELREGFKNNKHVKSARSSINDAATSLDERMGISKKVSDGKSKLTKEYAKVVKVFNKYKSNPDIIKKDIMNGVDLAKTLGEEKFKELQSTDTYIKAMSELDGFDKEYGISGKIGALNKDKDRFIKSGKKKIIELKDNHPLNKDSIIKDGKDYAKKIKNNYLGKDNNEILSNSKSKITKAYSKMTSSNIVRDGKEKLNDSYSTIKDSNAIKSGKDQASILYSNIKNIDIIKDGKDYASQLYSTVKDSDAIMQSNKFINDKYKTVKEDFENRDFKIDLPKLDMSFTKAIASKFNSIDLGNKDKAKETMRRVVKDFMNKLPENMTLEERIIAEKEIRDKAEKYMSALGIPFDSYGNPKERDNKLINSMKSKLKDKQESMSGLNFKMPDKSKFKMPSLKNLTMPAIGLPGLLSMGGLKGLFSSKEKKPKKNPFDKDGSGDRDGSWKDRLKAFGKKDKTPTDDATKKMIKDSGKSGFGISSLLMGTIPLITSTLGGLLGIGGKMFGGITSVVSVLGKILPGILNIGGLIGKGLMPLVGGLVKMLPSVLTKLVGGLGKTLGMFKKGGAKVAGKTAAKVAGKTAVKAGSKSAAKVAGKSLLKAGGKSLAKKIPVLGALAGLAFAGGRLMDGDLLGAGGEALSGIASIIPGFGTAASVGIDTWLAGRDMTSTEEDRKSTGMFDSWFGDDEDEKKDDTPAKEYIKNNTRRSRRNNNNKVSSESVPHTEVEGKPSGKLYTGKSSNSSNYTTSKLVLRDGPLAKGGAFGTNIVLGKGVRVDGFNPAFADQLNRMANEFFSITGKKIPINSGYRSKEDQMRLRKKYGNRAAKPGRSLHEFGLAFDTNSSVADELDKLGLLRKYGFTRPVGKEKWHIEASGVQMDINGAKKDPNLATKMIRSSIGKGGGGWALVSGARKYSRNLDFQKKLFHSNNEAKVMDNKATKANLDFGKPKIASTDSKGNFSALNDFKDSSSATKATNASYTSMFNPKSENGENTGLGSNTKNKAIVESDSISGNKAVEKLSSIDATLKSIYDVTVLHNKNTEAILASLGQEKATELTAIEKEELKKKNRRSQMNNGQAVEMPDPTINIDRKVV